MKKLSLLYSAGIFCVVFFGLMEASPAYGTTRYIAQTAGTFSGGQACNGQPAITPASFNGITNSPGDVNYICGTITGGTNAQLLAPSGNGASGNPVSIKFDTGAILQAPYFSATSGAINLDGHSYWVIDGQNTGTIQNTANGTALTYKQTSKAIEATNCNNCTVQNLTIANLYVHTSINDWAIDDTAVRCIDFNGSNWLIKGNTFHDAGWCLFENYNNGDANVEIANNTLYNITHGWMIATTTQGANSGPFLFHDNNVYNYVNWDTPMSVDQYHHDGIHCFTAANGTAAHIKSLQIYNNKFGPGSGVTVTAHIFLEGGSGGGATPCADSTSNINIFNNVFVADSMIYNGSVGFFSGAGGVYNNTFMCTPGLGGGVGFNDHGKNSGAVVFKNNAVTSCDSLMSVSTPITADFNAYGNSTSNTFNCGSNFYTNGQLSSWQSCISGDSHSFYNSSLGLDTTTGIPSSSSPVIGTGTNLSSLCNGDLAPLCSDKAGTPRSSSGSWTVGAYSSGAAGPKPSAATGLTGTVTAK
jgi:hypothetical protein